MTLLVMVLRKMQKNKWFIIFLMVGLLISSALMSSIPMYTQGVLQKVFVKDLESYQKDSESYPGGFTVTLHASGSTLNDTLRGVKDNNIFDNDKVKKYYTDFLNDFAKLDDYSKNNTSRQMSLPTLGEAVLYYTEPRQMIHDGFKPGDFDDSAFASIRSISDLEKHVKLVDGNLPSKTKVNGIYEVAVSEGALNKLKLTLNRVYVLSDVNKKGYAPLKVKPVGVFRPKEDDNIYWSAFKIANFDEAFLMDQGLMLTDLIKTEPTQLDSAKWYHALDYHALSLNNLDNAYSSENKIVRDLAGIRNEIDISFPLMDLASNYLSKEDKLKTMMWSLNVPVMIMLSIYLFMVSKLIIDKEKNEISLLISRGASRIQVVIGYVIEGLILALIAFIFGPILGLLLTKMLGASNGFLEFVNRKALDISLSWTSYGYSLLANVIFLITLLIPAYKASRTDIVDHKRKKSRETQSAFWQKIFLDVILIGISVYGYYVFNQRQAILKTAAVSGSDIQVDPLLFFVPVLFILGASLLCLRLYPLFLKIVYRLGKKVWPPSMYGTLVQVSRFSVSYHFLMVFIMLTLSIGIFSATAARTINGNAEDRIFYKNGSDIVIQPVWEMIESGGAAPSTPTGQPASAKKDDYIPTVKTIQYVEPPFEPYAELPEVEHAAKVFKRDDAYVLAGKKSSDNVSLMSIDPYDFGNVTWYRAGLLPYHINEYLNLLTTEESACIISKGLAGTLGVKAGDSIMTTWGNNKQVVFNVYAVADYWPSDLPVVNKDMAKVSEPNFMVTNLSYVQDNFPKEPYSIWLKLKEGASREQLFKDIAQNKQMFIYGLVDSKNDIINLKNNPSQLAINGSLTMGFLISGIICFLGFILYWVLSLKERSLQFGILRAIGLSSAQLKFMMVWEQLLTSGVAMAAGTVVGLIASKLYVSFFQMSASYEEQIPPFKVISYLSDRIKVYGFIGFTMVLGLGILIYLLSKIKISNVIKLGED